jgi:hypothetical protein
MRPAEGVVGAWRPIEPDTKSILTELIAWARPLVGDDSKRDDLDQLLDRIDDLLVRELARQKEQLGVIDTDQEDAVSRVPRLAIAEHIVATDTAATAAARETAKTIETFRELASEWKEDTLAESSLTKIVTHPAYQSIIGLGAPAVSLILRELEREPRQWFWALAAITREDPAEGQDTVDGAAQKWLEWGRDRGYVV